MRNLSFFLICLLTICTSCIKKNLVEDKENLHDIYNWKEDWEVPKQKEKLLNDEYLHKRFKEYLNDTSVVVLTSSLQSEIRNAYQSKSLGEINGDGIVDSIFVMPELIMGANSSIEMGASFIFSNPDIPRIKEEVGCLHVDYIFPVADIDEDGIVELGKYYTSCASRFKGLQLLTLKNKQWKIAGQVTFDLLHQDPPKEERIKKIGVGRFQMREITSQSLSNKDDRWIDFEIE